MRLGEALVKKGFVTPSDVEDALKEQRETRKPIGHILLQKQKVSEKNLLMTLGEQLQIPFVDLKKTPIMPEAVHALPAKLVIHYKIMPVSLKEKVLTIAFSDPTDRWPLDDIEINYGLQPVMVLACHDQITEMIQTHYGVGADTVEKIMVQDEGALSLLQETEEKLEEASVFTEEEPKKMEEDATVVRLVDQILKEAVRKGASDIHFERGRDTFFIRFRTDGVLADVRLPKKIHYLAPAIVSRIKIMSGMDIVEKRLPQDGRTRFKVGGKDYDLRVSVLPSRHGEDVAVRLLPSQTEFTFESLGMSPDKLKIFEKIINKPHGIVFVTGPTGSGKSTTLYTCLSRICTRDRKIVTVEDPIEYEIPGITQIQMHSAIGLTFARTLRNILRHDPDVIMIGEVRDPETAEIAIQAALTGHLVFSTLHTNDAASGVTRLLDMGIQPFLIASSVEAFIGQRLVRMICPECKVTMPEELAVRWKEYLGKGSENYLKSIKRGRGCNNCDRTGYKGRKAIYEILTIEGDIRDLVLKQGSAAQIKEMAVTRHNMQTMWQDGWQKVIMGQTTPEEVIRVVGDIHEQGVK